MNDLHRIVFNDVLQWFLRCQASSEFWKRRIWVLTVQFMGLVAKSRLVPLCTDHAADQLFCSLNIAVCCERFVFLLYLLVRDISKRSTASLARDLGNVQRIVSFHWSGDCGHGLIIYDAVSRTFLFVDQAETCSDLQSWRVVQAPSRSFDTLRATRNFKDSTLTDMLAR